MSPAEAVTDRTVEGTLAKNSVFNHRSQIEEALSTQTIMG
jgi:hypothetical protein